MDERVDEIGGKCCRDDQADEGFRHGCLLDPVAQPHIGGQQSEEKSAKRYVCDVEHDRLLRR
jgi:hypothetical protein